MSIGATYAKKKNEYDCLPQRSLLHVQRGNIAIRQTYEMRTLLRASFLGACFEQRSVTVI